MMEIKVSIFVLLQVLVRQCNGIIYRLNGSEFVKMPVVNDLNNYDQCLVDPKGIYCFADIVLVSEKPTDLYTMIQNYSEYSKKHYNHSLLHHGICVSQRCRRFLNENQTDLNLVIEACLNESLWEDFELKCRIPGPVYCNDKQHQTYIEPDGADVAMAALLGSILILNALGTLYDVFFVKNPSKSGNKLVLCFSVPRNFKKLVNSYDNIGPKEQRLKVLHGLRVLSMMCVIYSHSLWPMGLMPANTYFSETMFDNIFNYIFINGTIVVQTFFIISGFLLSYKLEVYAEKRRMTSKLLLSTIIISWIKLSPSHYVVLAFVATWARFAGAGPFWEEAVMREVVDCRKHAWKHALYISNYFDYDECMPQTWYVAANMQLYVLGFFVCILGGKFKKILLIILFIIGCLGPAAHTYFQDLNAVLMVNPESIRNFMHDNTFNEVYKRGHTNIVNFVLGIALGYFVYRLQKKEVSVKKFMVFRYLFVLAFPAVIGTMLLGSVFYLDGIVTSAYTRAAYAALIKPLFGAVIATLILGGIFKIDPVNRVILEWRGWKVLGKLSYCAYLIHMPMIKIAAGRATALVSFTGYRMIEIMVAFIALGYLAALLLWVLVDAPINGFLLNLLAGKALDKEKSNEKAVSDNHSHVTLKTIQAEEGNAKL